MKNAPIKNLQLGLRPRTRPGNYYKKGLRSDKIFDSSVSIGPYNNFLNEIILLTEKRKSSYVCFANVHMIVEAAKDPSFNAVVNAADIVAPDGKLLSLFLRLFKKTNQDSVCSTDIMPDLLRKAALNKKSVYFYGTTDEVLQAVVLKTKRDFPSLRVGGYYSPPFRDLTEEEKDKIVNKINRTAPDLVFVALGCPKQEKWMAEQKGKVFACMLGVGQAFKAYAGLESPLPSWMRHLSLEWIYRLYLEPKHLWKKYLFPNTLFLLLTLKYLGQRFFGTSPGIELSKAMNDGNQMN